MELKIIYSRKARRQIENLQSALSYFGLKVEDLADLKELKEEVVALRSKVNELNTILTDVTNVIPDENSVLNLNGVQYSYNELFNEMTTGKVKGGDN